VIAISMFYFLRMFSGALLPLLTGFISLLWTVAFMTYVHVPMQVLISMLPLMLFIIGATEDTHIMSEYIEGLEHKGSRYKAITYFSEKITVAILMTSITTIIGFATVTVNKIIMLKEFGLVLAGGYFLILSLLFCSFHSICPFLERRKVHSKIRTKTEAKSSPLRSFASSRILFIRSLCIRK